MSEPLTPELYSRLLRVFGKVVISNPGQEAEVRKGLQAPCGTLKLFGRRPTISKSFVIDVQVKGGEYYIVNCPFCGDQRKRLWISYLWAEYPKLAHCYNENCLEKEANRASLRLMIFHTQRSVKLPVREGRKDAAQLPNLEPPGNIVSIDELPHTHRAYRYIAEDRGYDPGYLSSAFGVGYCLSVNDSKYHQLVDRIYLPLYMRGNLVGWQGRYIGELDWKASNVRKYYNMPGMAARLILANFDTANLYDDIVLVEGWADVWCVGPQAMGVLRHNLSSAQRAELLAWRHRGCVVILQDGDVPEEAEKMRLDLSSLFGSRVFVVKLPSDKDPDDIGTEGVWELINKTAENNGQVIKRANCDTEISQFIS